MSRPKGDAVNETQPPINYRSKANATKSEIEAAGHVLVAAGALQQDVCIIDEQPDHLVLMVRVPKATILANHAMLL
jgi:hypothetical protein